jgi:hypothetical protein
MSLGRTVSRDEYSGGTSSPSKRQTPRTQGTTVVSWLGAAGARGFDSCALVPLPLTAAARMRRGMSRDAARAGVIFMASR